MTEAPALPVPSASARWESNAEFWVRIIRGRHDRYRTELRSTASTEHARRWLTS